MVECGDIAAPLVIHGIVRISTLSFPYQNVLECRKNSFQFIGDRIIDKT
jgi:hypothetical protein